MSDRSPLVATVAPGQCSFVVTPSAKRVRCIAHAQSGDFSSRCDCYRPTVLSCMLTDEEQRSSRTLLVVQNHASKLVEPLRFCQTFDNLLIAAMDRSARMMLQGCMRRLLNPTKGTSILLFGDQGAGAQSICIAMCRQMGLNAIIFDCTDVDGMFDIKDAIAAAAAMRPAVVLVDNLDRLSAPQLNPANAQWLDTMREDRLQRRRNLCVSTMTAALQLLPEQVLLIGIARDITQSSLPNSLFVQQQEIEKLNTHSRQALLTCARELCGEEVSRRLADELQSSNHRGFAFAALRETFDDYSTSLRHSLGSAKSTFAVVNSQMRSLDILFRKHLRTVKNLTHWSRQYAQYFQRLGLDRSGSNIVLYGPTGSGKSSFARHWASSQGYALVMPHICDIVHSAFGESEKSLRRQFAIARRSAPCLLFFDEFEAIFVAGDERDSDLGLLSTLISSLDDIVAWNANSEAKVIVALATRAPWKMDNRLLQSRRFGKALKFGPIEKSLRDEFLQQVRNEDSWTSTFDTESVSWLEEKYSHCQFLSDILKFRRESRYCAQLRTSEEIRTNFSLCHNNNEETAMQPYNQWEQDSRLRER